MAIFKPFRAFRPAKEFQQKVPALPYDVMSSEEAREMAKGNPYSFLYVDRPEINFEAGVDMYSPEVYRMAGKKLAQLENEGILVQDEKPCFYIYRQISGDCTQTGIVGCAGVDDYINNVIKKHEHTRSDKERDRINHVTACNANTGPIFLTYRENSEITKIISEKINFCEAVYDFTSDGVEQKVWVIDDCSDVNRIAKLFNGVEAMYIADGHHRCASAVKVATQKRKQKPDYTGEEEFNRFLAVAFPKEQLNILPYNRVVADLNGCTSDEFTAQLEKIFAVKKLGSQPCKPCKKHTFGMYLDHCWYELEAKACIVGTKDVVKSLDVSVLQDNVLAPILGITDPKTDKRIDFVGGIRGTKELEKRAASDKRVAFSMHPTSMDELLAIADAGKIMPPKSTWFEPKLLSGIFIHHLD